MSRRRRRHQKQSKTSSFIRIILALVYLSMATLQFIFFFSHGSEVYKFYSVHTIFGVYRYLFDKLILPHPDPFTVLLIAFEITVAVLILNKEQWAKIGLISGAVFCVLIS